MVAIAQATQAQEVHIWPENWPAFELFESLRTQWRAGFGGPTGLCYEAVYPLIDRLTTTREEWERLFEDIRLMEREALSVMQETP